VYDRKLHLRGNKSEVINSILREVYRPKDFNGNGENNITANFIVCIGLLFTCFC
jgi:hypothetical protein